MENRRFIGGVEVVQGEDGLWRDKFGTIFALADETRTLDPEVRCGVAPFALPTSDQWTDACRPHDYKYSSPAYQEFHEREEADRDLARDMKLVSQSWFRRALVPIVHRVVRVFGKLFWENKTTQ